jgi:Uma2 family endonuclease
MERQRLESIEGDLIVKARKTRRQVHAHTRLVQWLLRTAGRDFVNFGCPIDVAPRDNPTSEPEPDLIVLRRPFDDFDDANPSPADLQLVVEVSDSTLAFDLTRKSALYARAGIQEYWVVDLVNARLIVHREPRPEDSGFASIRIVGRDESIAPLAAPHAALKVADVLPPAPKQ